MNAVLDVPKVYQEFLDAWERRRDPLVAAYCDHRVSFVPNLLPAQAVQLTPDETLSILTRRLGTGLADALQHADPEQPASALPPSVRSPVRDRTGGSWLKQSNMVGINVRTVGSFWNVIKYALTLPHSQDAIHLLPIWEPGVVGSLYGMSSWFINDEFFSAELAEAYPELDTVERQLKAVINLLHAMGKAVGMDVIPHTDRFSEIVLAQPHYFEWLQREDTEIVDHAAHLHEQVQDRILDFLSDNGPAVPGDDVPTSREAFFSEAVSEALRSRIFFGRPEDRSGRTERRIQLIRYLVAYGYEPVPATMAPPFRGLRVDIATAHADSHGDLWRDYAMTEPQSMSRVFGPLTRYKLYERLNDNTGWEIDFDRPRKEVWAYVCGRYAEVQRRYGFDFMRGDMAHVQMRPGGVPESPDDTYDILRAVKHHIQLDRGVDYFGYFAETFLGARDAFLYGDEVDHLEASDADTTLGDLQSTCVGSPDFLLRFRRYYDLLTTRDFAPSFTLITGDKDDPRFDEYYLKGSAVRFFIAFFLTDMPSYMSLGFETREAHYQPAPNEHYTKLYVFQESCGPRATTGPYVWGRNGWQFHVLTRLRLYVDQIFQEIRGRPTQWLIHPDPSGENRHIAWTLKDGSADYVFVVNTDTERGIRNFNIPRIPNLDSGEHLECHFTTAHRVPDEDAVLAFRYKGYKVTDLGPGEARVYRPRPSS
ncbi:hypothetical protein JXA88_05410 [Candidatus Fermentibacteria bacterium]|nr:hypothetical protein [Candidatus Fermentibacteria bacterium]